MYTIRTTENGFLLEISYYIYETDEELLLGTMNIHVVSGDFSAKASMDVSAYKVAEFARDLYHLYEHLSGTATIRGTFSNESNMEFSILSRGHIHVKGILTDDGQTLSFNNEFNQTYLKAFATDLYNDYMRYLKSYKTSG